MIPGKEKENVSSGPEEVFQKHISARIPFINQATEAVLGKTLGEIDYSPLTSDKISVLSDEETEYLLGADFLPSCPAYFSKEKGMVFNWEAFLRDLEKFDLEDEEGLERLAGWSLFRLLAHENIHRLCKRRVLGEEEDEVVWNFFYSLASETLKLDLEGEERRVVELQNLLEEEDLEIAQQGLEFRFIVADDSCHRVGKYVDESLVLYLTGLVVGRHGMRSVWSAEEEGIGLNYYLSGNIPEVYVDSIKGIRGFIERQGLEKVLTSYFNGRFYSDFIHPLGVEQRWDIFLSMHDEKQTAEIWESINGNSAKA